MAAGAARAAIRPLAAAIKLTGVVRSRGSLCVGQALTQPSVLTCKLPVLAQHQDLWLARMG